MSSMDIIFLTVKVKSSHAERPHRRTVSLLENELIIFGLNIQKLGVSSTSIINISLFSAQDYYFFGLLKFHDFQDFSRYFQKISRYTSLLPPAYGVRGKVMF